MATRVGAETLRRSLSDWLTDMHMISAGGFAETDGYIGYMEPYATSHQALDEDEAFQEEVRNAARALGNAIRLDLAGRFANPAKGLVDPEPEIDNSLGVRGARGPATGTSPGAYPSFRGPAPISGACYQGLRIFKFEQGRRDLQARSTAADVGKALLAIVPGVELKGPCDTSEPACVG